jgi:hypothetical protein
MPLSVRELQIVRMPGEAASQQIKPVHSRRMRMTRRCQPEIVTQSLPQIYLIEIHPMLCHIPGP